MAFSAILPVLHVKNPGDERVTLKGKTAVVTGGAGGIGRATSLQLARDGAAIAIWDVDTAGAQETARLINESGVTGHTLSVNGGRFVA